LQKGASPTTGIWQTRQKPLLTGSWMCAQGSVAPVSVVPADVVVSTCSLFSSLSDMVKTSSSFSQADLSSCLSPCRKVKTCLPSEAYTGCQKFCPIDWSLVGGSSSLLRATQSSRIFVQRTPANCESHAYSVRTFGNCYRSSQLPRNPPTPHWPLDNKIQLHHHHVKCCNGV
jgi:hypothetical protein